MAGEKGKRTKPQTCSLLRAVFISTEVDSSTSAKYKKEKDSTSKSG
jgi:hypothetical protein